MEEDEIYDKHCYSSGCLNGMFLSSLKLSTNSVGHHVGAAENHGVGFSLQPRTCHRPKAHCKGSDGKPEISASPCSEKELELCIQEF
jgi:hypothetical protein